MTIPEQTLLETISEQLLIISKQQADTQALLKQLLETLQQSVETVSINDIAALIEPLAKQQRVEQLLSLLQAQRAT